MIWVLLDGVEGKLLQPLDDNNLTTRFHIDELQSVKSYRESIEK